MTQAGISFNPCFSGLAFATEAASRSLMRYYLVSILVLVDWPLRHSPHIHLIVYVDYCFNPCFSGLAFATDLLSF